MVELIFRHTIGCLCECIFVAMHDLCIFDTDLNRFRESWKKKEWTIIIPQAIFLNNYKQMFPTGPLYIMTTVYK
jgi:hypothetical protein